MKKIFTFCIALFSIWAVNSVAQNPTLIEIEDGVTAGAITIAAGDNVVLEGESYAGVWVEINGDATVTLRNLVLVNPDTSVIYLNNNANVTLILEGDNIVSAGTYNDAGGTGGIIVPSGAKITIQGNGILWANGRGTGPAGAAIGGLGGTTNQDPVAASGEIVINSGTIFAIGGSHNASSIGGGYKGVAGPITINGGTVVAQAIGGGSGGGWSTIDFTGGTTYVTYSFGNKVNNGTVGTVNISGNALLFSSSYCEGDKSAGVTVSGNATWYNGAVDAELVQQFTEDYAGHNIVMQINTDIVVPAGLHLSVPAGLTIDTQGYDIEVYGTYNVLGNVINGTITDLSGGGSTTITVDALSEGETGIGWSYSAGVVTVATGANVTATGTAADIQILVEGTSTLTIDGLTLTATKDNTVGSPIKLADNADVNLIIKGENLIDPRDIVDGAEQLQLAGIEVNEDSKITIDGDGVLTVFGSTNPNGTRPAGAAIGALGGPGAADGETTSGEIVINGGTIYAHGGSHSAASIGGAYKGIAGPITINGGVIVADAIGGGSGGGWTSIDITGGTVYVYYSFVNRIGNGSTTGTAAAITDDAVVFVARVREGATTQGEGENAKTYVTVAETATFVNAADGGGEVSGTISAKPITFKLPADLTVPAPTVVQVPAGVVLDFDGYEFNATYEGEGEVINNGYVAIPTVALTSAKIYAANGVLYAPEATSIVVRSISGQTVLRSAKSEVNISALPKGVYVVQAVSAQGINTTKIVNR